jgi:sulfate adenylyltransferase subunit 2
LNSNLQDLESEAIEILREVRAGFTKPVLLFSGGKDSLTLIELIRQAVYPSPFPMPLLHIDTGHNFHETLQFRDRLAKSVGAELIVREVQASIDAGLSQDEVGPYASRNRIQSVTLMQAVREFGFDCLIGGARRDEEKARAKERVFSHRNAFGEWVPRDQRPELWTHYNTLLTHGEHMRVFPLSNWTELDVWQYIEYRKLQVPELYFAHERECVRVQGQALVAFSDFIRPQPGDTVEKLNVRFRTVGDMTCTAAFPSSAQNISEIITEIQRSRLSERGTRLDDQRSDTAMEDRKKEGYF